MSSSSSVLNTTRPPIHIRHLWATTLAARPRGLQLEAEKGSTLVWDEAGWLYLLNRHGDRQAQVHFCSPLVSAAAADDGSAYAAIGPRGELWWLAPDLTTRWEKRLEQPGQVVALDSFGQYLALADQGNSLRLFDRTGLSVASSTTVRPLRYLSFLTAAPHILGSADHGLVACFDMTAKCIWRDGLVAHIGSLSASGDGGEVLLSCYSEGVQRYTSGGKNLGRWHVPEAVRLATVSHDGRRVLVAGLASRLLLLHRQGGVIAEYDLDKPATAIALSPLADRLVAGVAGGRLICCEIYSE